MRNLEYQIGQLATTLSSRQTDTMLITTETPKPNGKKHYKAIILETGKEVLTSAGQEGDTCSDKAKRKVQNEESEFKNTDLIFAESSEHTAAKETQ